METYIVHTIWLMVQLYLI